MKRIGLQEGNKPLVTRFGTVLVLATVLVLSGCIMNPSDDSDSSSGVVTINVPLTGSSVGGSDIGASAITANTRVRVWMYTPEGNEYRLAPTGTGIPTARNYVEAAGGGSIVIDKIPAGDGYGLVAVVDDDITDDSGVFVPDRYALEGSFSVAAGRETEVVLNLQNPEETAEVGSFGTASATHGKDVHSVVRIGAGPAAGVWSTTRSQVFLDGALDLSVPNSTTINSVSIGRVSDGGDPPSLIYAPFFNTNERIRYYDGSYGDVVTGIGNVTDSGAFYDAGADEVTLYYQRLGGLGGVSFAVGSSFPATADWNDTGDDLSEVVADDESPVWASAASNSAAYISSVLGTFRATEELFNSTDIDVDALLGGNSSAGLTFFSVAYPGTSRPLRIREIGVSPSGGNVIVGTGRGAFYFPESSIDGVNGGFVSGVTAIPQTDGQFIVDMSVRDGYVAILTPSRLVVAKPGSGSPRLIPLRAVTLGLPRDIFIADTGSGSVTVYIAGSEGLSQVVFSAP